MKIRRKRQPRRIEASEFAGFARRIVRAFGRRVAAGDVEALGDLVAIREAIDQALIVAVTGLRHQGYSYGQMAGRLGCTRQNVWAQWGRMICSTDNEPRDGSRPGGECIWSRLHACDARRNFDGDFACGDGHVHPSRQWVRREPLSRT